MPVLTGASLKGLLECLSLAYKAEACLSSREGRSVGCAAGPTGSPLSLEGTEDLKEEFRLLNRLSRQLPGSVPTPMDFR